MFLFILFYAFNILTKYFFFLFFQFLCEQKYANSSVFSMKIGTFENTNVLFTKAKFEGNNSPFLYFCGIRKNQLHSSLKFNWFVLEPDLNVDQRY